MINIDLKSNTKWAAITTRTGNTRNILTWMAIGGSNSDGRGKTYKEMEFEKVCKDIRNGSRDLSVGHILHPFKDVYKEVLSADFLEFGIVELFGDSEAPSLNESDSVLGAYIDRRFEAPQNYSFHATKSFAVSENNSDQPFIHVNADSLLKSELLTLLKGFPENTAVSISKKDT